jgi:hypothetical protein
LKRLSPLERQRGEQLAQFLNGELERHTEIGRLLDWCQQVFALYRKRPPLSQSPERIAYERHLATLLTNVNHQVLYKFEVVPRLEASEQGLATGWSSVQPLHPAEVQRLRAFKSGLAPITAHSAVHIILEMTSAATIDRIRQCENPDCRKWLMVTSTKRVTCNDACRFAKFQMQKGSRANDMRKSRKFHKDHPNVKRQTTTRPAKTAKRKRGEA